MTITAFVDEALLDLRRRHGEILAVIPPDVRDPSLPCVDPGLDSHVADARLLERALRERAEALIASEALLSTYLDRARRHAFASAIASTIVTRYRELAGDAPAGMDMELKEAEGLLDATVTLPDYAESMVIARLLPLIAWADHLAAL